MENSDNKTCGGEGPVLWEDARRRMGGRDALLVKLSELVLQELPGREAGLCEAIQNADPQAIAKAAHQLDGALATVGARQAALEAAAIEAAARGGAVERTAELLPQLRNSLQPVVEELNRFLARHRE